MPRLRENRAEQILQAGEELFFARGFAAVGVDEIGKRAGITGPAIYRHFSGKDEILANLFDEAIDALMDATAGTFDDPNQALEHLVREHAGFVFRQRRLAGVRLREERLLAEPFARRLRRRERVYVNRWLDCVERCYPNADPDVRHLAVTAALGTLNAAAEWPNRAFDDERAPDVLASAALAGLRLLADGA